MWTNEDKMNTYTWGDKGQRQFVMKNAETYGGNITTQTKINGSMNHTTMTASQ